MSRDAGSPRQKFLDMLGQDFGPDVNPAYGCGYTGQTAPNDWFTRCALCGYAYWQHAIARAHCDLRNAEEDRERLMRENAEAVCPHTAQGKGCICEISSRHAWFKAFAEHKDKLAAAEQRAEALVSAIRKLSNYAVHHDDCDVDIWRRGGTGARGHIGAERPACNCGLAEALKAGEQD